MRYKYLDDLTSDVLFEAYGKTQKEVFENSAEAMFGIICKLKQVKPEKAIDVEASGENPKELLFNWLQKLIALVDIEEMFFSKFEIINIDNNKLTAKAYGETTSPEKGETVVKSVTYYKFSLEETKDRWKSVISVDI